MRARRTAGALGAATLMLLLTGCFSTSGQLSIDSDGAVSGTQRVEISKQVASVFGATSLDAFEKLVETEDLGSSLGGLTPSAEPSTSGEGAEDECPSLEYGETDVAFVVTCTFDDFVAAPGSDSSFTAQRIGDTIEFRYEESGSDTGGDELGIPGTPTDSSTAGVVDLVFDFPGPITSVGGPTAARATQVDADTIRISGPAMESYDITVVSAATGGTNAEPAPDSPLGDTGVTGGSVTTTSTGSDDDGAPVAFIAAGGVFLLALVAGLVALVLVRRGRSTPAPAAAGHAPDAVPGSAPVPPATPAPAGPPPGWYPHPEDPAGAPRYWDGASWSPPAP